MSILNSIIREKLRIFVKKEESAFLEDPSYSPCSIRSISSKLSIDRRTVVRYIKIFLEHKDLYSQMWPHSDPTSHEVLDKLKAFIKKEELRFKSEDNYIPLSLVKMGELFNINRKVVEKYAKRFLKDESLYAHMWTIRTGRPSQNCKKQLKKMIYTKLKDNFTHPSQLEPECFLRKLGSKYINIEYILSFVRYSYIIYFLIKTRLSTWKIGEILSPIFNQSAVSLRSMTLKISNLLERDFEDYSQKVRSHNDAVFKISAEEIVKIHKLVRKYKRYKSRKELHSFFQELETEYNGVNSMRSHNNLADKISSNEYRRIKSKLSGYRRIQEMI